MKTIFRLIIAFIFIVSVRTSAQYGSASSLWLTYLNAPTNQFDMLSIDFEVDSTALYTYYAAMCWDNGYGGVQRGGGGFYKHVHFSLWDPEGMTSQVIWHDYNVVVQRFGGEGTGWKTMWNFRWKEHQKYRMVVKCHVSDSTDYDAWFFDYQKGKWKHLAILRYPLPKYYSYLTSFLEDWAGTPDKYRAYYLSNARARIADDSSWFEFSSARYNINGDNPNCDGRVVNNKFFLETGGNINPTNSNGTILTVAVNGFVPRAAELGNIEIADINYDSVKIIWHYDDYYWAAQQDYSITIAADNNFDNIVAQLEKKLCSDSAATVYVSQFDSTQTYYLKLKVNNIFDLQSEKVISFTGRTVVFAEDSVSNAGKFVLYQNYPNPFNPTTTIRYKIPSVIAREQSDRSNLSNSTQNQWIVHGILQTANLTASNSRNGTNVQLIVYDVLGRKIATLVNERQLPGNYAVQFDASDLPSGIYFYVLRTGNFYATKKMILLK